jgi:hypothetical protein
MLCLESALNNCTIVANTAEQKGGGVYFDLSDTSTLRNTILYGNFAWGGGGNYANYYNADLVTFCCCCTTPDPGGAGNITNDPRFVNAAAGNYRLSAASPCINAGTNGTWVTVTDLDGGPRIRGGTVDMGAYECGDPLVTITNTVTVVPPTQTTIVIGGAKNPLVVGAMLYTNAATGASGSFPAQMSWTTPALSLAYGDNRITITGTNAEGGTASASITIWRDMTPPGNALAFDGTNDYVQIADANSLDLTNNYTLEAWINVDSFKWLGGIIGKYQVASANGYVLRLGKYGAYDGINFDQMDTATNLLQSNRWYHVAGVNSNGTRRLYLNGVEQVLSGTPLTIQANTNILTLGVDFLADPRYFDGRMDEVRIWNVVRSEAQIRDAMHK